MKIINGMITNLKFLSVSALMVLFLIFTGCEKKDQPAVTEDTQKTETTVTETETPKEETPVEEEKPVTPSLVGTWKGKFDNRNMTLTITKMEGNSFEGETVVRWDSPKTEKVTGTVDFDTREMVITETAAGRNNGKYTGTVSADMKKFVGTWKDNGNRLTYNITLNFE